MHNGWQEKKKVEVGGSVKGEWEIEENKLKKRKGETEREPM